jgi:hypothetical protein
MHCVGSSHSFAAGQIWRGRLVFQFSFEHCFRSARNGKHSVEDYDWRSGRVHVDCANALFAGSNGHAFGFAIDYVGSNTNTNAATVTRYEPGDSRNGCARCSSNKRITKRVEVICNGLFAADERG